MACRGAVNNDQLVACAAPNPAVHALHDTDREYRRNSVNGM